MNEPIRASGGLVFRPAGESFEVLVVHRPRYDDWSLPKGKDDPGETAGQAAVREVEEETGVAARVIVPLAETRYRVPDGQEKAVRFFAMRPVAERTFVPNAEVDEVRWVPVADCDDLLTYRRDRDLVAGTDLSDLAETTTVLLVRHAAAGSRSKWEGDDTERPVSDKGRKQSEALVGTLAPYGIDAILTSRYLRCRQTVEPLGEALGLPVDDHPALAEGADWLWSLELIESLDGRNAVLCSHGDVIPKLVSALHRRGTPVVWKDESPILPHRKGSTWVLSCRGETVTMARYLPPPEVPTTSGA